MNKVIFTGTIVELDPNIHSKYGKKPFIGGEILIVSQKNNDLILPFMAFGSTIAYRILINGRPGASVLISGKLKLFSKNNHSKKTGFYIEIEEIYFGDPVQDEKALAKSVAAWKEQKFRDDVNGKRDGVESLIPVNVRKIL